MPYHPAQLVVSVEHASHAVPAALGNLGLPRNWLESHHGWDPGAPIVGRMVARAFGAPLHLGRWTRLVADLNRSSNHPRAVPRTTGNRTIAANDRLDRAGRRERIARYWSPFRDAVEADLDRAVAAHGLAFHLSVHSFTDRFRGERRTNDFGLLYDPKWRVERALADRLHERLQGAGFSVRRNHPYSGLDDGFCRRMRAQRSQRSYIGMEIELNQKHVRRQDGARRLGAALVEALRPEFAARGAGAGISRRTGARAGRRTG